MNRPKAFQLIAEYANENDAVDTLAFLEWFKARGDFDLFDADECRAIIWEQLMAQTFAGSRPYVDMQLPSTRLSGHWKPWKPVDLSRGWGWPVTQQAGDR